MKEGKITMGDGRTVGFADFGPSDGIPVLWCHGGPGCRLEPEPSASAAARMGLRFVGIDRPGYGYSTPWPGRTIGGWVPDGLAVADHLGIDRFVTVGCSTGGSYALALASLSERVIGTVACCAVSDMRWPEGRAMNVSCHPVWNAPDRETALAIIAAEFGEDGHKIATPPGDFLSEPDKAMYADPEFLACWQSQLPVMFHAHGVAGFVDDRLADGHGWDTFDVAAIECPVIVLHGGSDRLCPLPNAHHTAAIVPGASLRIFDDHGHISILREIAGTVRQLLD